MLTRNEIIDWLQAEDATELFRKADHSRQQQTGDAVFFRGIIEFSNYCSDKCAYCGISALNHKVQRYRMPVEEVIELALKIDAMGINTVVLQSGEDPHFSTSEMLEVIAGIRAQSEMAITLSMGELPDGDYLKLCEAGADRYLMRFETSEPDLFAELHNGHQLSTRLEQIEQIRAAGFQLGTGFLIGLPGQSLPMLADDILLTARLQPPMIGVGPFIAHPETPLRDSSEGDLELALRMVALLRLTNPTAHIPGTTALDALAPDAREQALKAGANIVMPNFTPSGYREHYFLYPGKPLASAVAVESYEAMKKRILALGRPIGEGRGDALEQTS
jgi:biotin synthase